MSFSVIPFHSFCVWNVAYESQHNIIKLETSFSSRNELLLFEIYVLLLKIENRQELQVYLGSILLKIWHWEPVFLS